MKVKVFRGNTIGMVILSCFLSMLFIGFSVWSFYIFAVEPIPAGVLIFISVLDCCLLLLGMLYLVENLHSYFKRIQVLDDQLVLICPLKKRKVIRADELSCWGCVSYTPRSTMLFLCTADQDTILNFLNTHRPLCERVFGMQRISRLEQSDEGVFRLAVGTYLYKCLFSLRQDVFILNYGTTDRLKTLVNILKKDALVTGPWLIDTMSAWEEYAKYRPETEND